MGKTRRREKSFFDDDVDSTDAEGFVSYMSNGGRTQKRRKNRKDLRDEYLDYLDEEDEESSLCPKEEKT